MIRELKFKLHFRRHGDEVYRFARSILGRSADAEDATQEVFLRFWKHLDSVRGREARPWLFRTTRNYCIDQIRRRNDRLSFAGDAPLVDHSDEQTPDPRQAAEGTEFRRRFDQALQKLPEKWRSVFVLYEINGLRYREIGETLDMPLNSVKVYLSRARKELKNQLKPEKTWIPN